MRRYRLSASVRLNTCNGQGILMDVKHGKYYSLSSVGVRVISALAAGHSNASIISKLESEFKEPRYRLEGDLQSFLTDLVSRNLCEACDD